MLKQLWDIIHIMKHHPYHEILLSYKKDWATDMHNNLDGFPGIYAELKKKKGSLKSLHTV